MILGKGAFGCVYLGMNDIGKLVAIKELSVSLQVEHQEEMLKEIRLLSTFRHDNIVAYLGSAVVSKSLLIVMEYVSCGSLAFILSHFGKLPSSSVSQYSRHILRGLIYLHSHDVVHRDIKPANLLLDESGRCKLTDFGTADRFTTMKTDIKGTPMYMSPEALQGKTVKASDIWSFGLTIMELLTGSTPWDTGGCPNPFYIMNMIIATDVLPDFSHLPAVADGFIRSCVTRDPLKRPTAEQLVENPFLL
jgi:serine/threonine protein kinase